MKTRILSLITTFVLGIAAVYAQPEKKEEFKVAGNCGMCKNRIEKAAKSVGGVSFANWDQESKVLEVKFNPSKASIHTIHKDIAKAGHDTQMHKASQEAYDNLPVCCKYERLAGKEGGSHGHEGHKHSK
jgi:copper chaperone CopZ